MGRVTKQEGGQGGGSCSERQTDNDPEKVQVLRHPVEHEVPAAVQVAAPERTTDVREDGVPAENAERDLAGQEGGQLLWGQSGQERVQEEAGEEGGRGEGGVKK